MGKRREALEALIDVPIALACAGVVFQACALVRQLWASLVFLNCEIPGYARWSMTIAARPLGAACLRGC